MMASEIIKVQNVKCGGCASNIQQGLEGMSGINSVTVEVATGEVSLEGDVIDRAAVITQLKELGYPAI